MMGRVNNLPVPETMKGVYQEVIDRLDNDELWILTIASVLGVEKNEEFSEEDLIHVYKTVQAYRSKSSSNNESMAVSSEKNVMMADFNAHVNNLIDKALLIRVTKSDTNLFRFQRKELMEVVYGKASFSVRRRIHLAYAELLELALRNNRKKLSVSGTASMEKRLSQNRMAELQKAENFSLVGNHYKRAVDLVKAHEYLSCALVIYKRLYEYRNIIETTTQLLAILSRDNHQDGKQEEFFANNSEERRRTIVLLKRDLGTVYLRIGRLDQAFPLLNSALSLCGVNQSALEPMQVSTGESLLRKLLDTWVHCEQKTQLPHKNKDFHLIFESGRALLALASHNFDIKSFETGVPLLIKSLNLGLVPKDRLLFLQKHLQ